MDAHLASAWHVAAHTPTIVRSNVDDTVMRTVAPREAGRRPWSWCFIHNPAHATGKRKPAVADTSLRRPVDPAHFNFTKVREDEVLMVVPREVEHGHGFVVSGDQVPLSVLPTSPDTLATESAAVLINARCGLLAGDRSNPCRHHAHVFS